MRVNIREKFRENIRVKFIKFLIYILLPGYHLGLNPKRKNNKESEKEDAK
jgi:hypothetical protein